MPIPAALLEKLAVHPLSRDLYPTSLGHYRRARDHRMSRERHDEHLLIYCSEGQGLLRVREGETWREYRVGSGDLLWLPPGMAHDYAADDRQPWTIFWTHLRGDSATWLQHSAGYRDTPLRHWGLQHALLGGFEQLLEVRHSGYRFQHFLLAASRLRSLLCQLPLLRPLREGSLDLDGLHAYMREHLHARLELERLAAFCNLSKFHFVSRYKAITGTYAYPALPAPEDRVRLPVAGQQRPERGPGRPGGRLRRQLLLLAPVQQGHGFVAERLPAAGKAGRGRSLKRSAAGL